MATIVPIRAWRYKPEIPIQSVIAPLFDVATEKQRQQLYKNPQNSIYLSVPPPQTDLSNVVQNWKKEILVQDKQPAIYVYYQYFSAPNSDVLQCRKGFIAHLKVADWNEKVVLRHESTIPNAVGERAKILEETRLHASATHGLYTDETQCLEPLMEEAIAQPLYETEDFQGVKNVIAVITDVKKIQHFVKLLANKSIILADGHHRYQASIELKKKNVAVKHEHLMYFSNTVGNDYCILPTHRLLKNIPNFQAELFLEKLSHYFHLQNVEESSDLDTIILGKKYCFGLILGDESYKITLKPHLENEITWQFQAPTRQLGLTVLHYFAFYKAAGLSAEQQKNSENIVFERNMKRCLQAVEHQEVQAAFITHPVTMSEIVQVCEAGDTMPQKSTYFYPKLVSGFLFSDISV
jgi:uncharacterized protein (DUF1015 family)